MNKDVIIETERLILRKCKMNDIADMVEELNNIVLQRYEKTKCNFCISKCNFCTLKLILYKKSGIIYM